MVRTLTQIQGEYGLPANAQSDMFSASEQSVLNTIEKALAQQNSQAIEQMAGRGMGRSSFTEGLLQQKQTDVMGNVFNQFAQNRLGYDTSSALSKQAYEQNLELQRQGLANQSYYGQQTANNALQQGAIYSGLNQFTSNYGQTGGNKKAISGIGTAVGSMFGPVGSLVGGLFGGLFG